MTPNRPLPSLGRRGFTLVELLIVIGIIALIATIALPAFNAISGGRSIDSAQNQVSAVLAQVRADAIAAQDYRGAVIFQDVNTGRVALSEVYNTSAADQTLIDLAPGRDELLLPVGVGTLIIQDGGAFLRSGVIMFDPSGKVVSRLYKYPTAGLLKTRLDPAGAGTNITAGSDMSQIGFYLFDQATYQIQSEQQPGNAIPTEWVRTNGLPFVVNRYNGTLMRGE